MDTIRYTLSVTWKEIQLILKERGALAIFFLLPLLLGSMMGGTNMMMTSDEEASILLKVGLVNEDSGEFGKGVADALQSIEELDVTTYATAAEAEEQVAKGEAAAAIVIPASFTQDINAYTPTTIQVIVDPGAPESASIVTGIMNQVVAEVTIWGEVQYGIRTVLEESGALAEASLEQQSAIGAQTLGVVMTTLNEMRQTPAIAVRSEAVGGAQAEGWVQTYFATLFPGFTVMFVFFTVTMSASSLLKECETGVLRRLLAASLPRGAVIAGEMLAYVLLSCMQVVVLFGVAAIAFKMPLGRAPLALVTLTLIVALTANALGMMIAALAKSASQASSAGILLSFVLGGIGGCIPTSGTLFTRSGGFLGILANLTPQGHAMEGFFRIMGENATFVQALPQMGILLVMAVVFFLIAVWRFKFE